MKKEMKSAAIITGRQIQKKFREYVELYGRHSFFMQGIIITCEIHLKVTKIVTY